LRAALGAEKPLLNSGGHRDVVSLLASQLPLPDGRGLQLVVSPLRLLTGSLATIRSTEGSDISGGIQISIDLEAATLALEGSTVAVLLLLETAS